MTKYECIDKINELGKKRIPFLFIIDFDFKKPIIIPLSEIDSAEILYQTPQISNFAKSNSKAPAYTFGKQAISFDEYKLAYDKVFDNIINGNSYLLNLTFPSKLSTSLSLIDIFAFSSAKYKLFLKDKFVCFSPEIFVKINNGIISSYPMKGTIDASIANALDTIMSDEKEIAEHNTIVDLIRNDLSIVSKNVRVTKFRYPDYLKTNSKHLIQISSEIMGDLHKNYHEQLGDLIAKLLPAGSVTGAPKKKTVEIIKSAENYDRNFYTGVFGVFDGVNLDSAVMIRFIEQTNDGLVFKSGGGITSLSTAESEYQELKDKVYVPIY